MKPALEDLRPGDWYQLRYVRWHNGVRYDFTLTMPLLLELVEFRRGQPCMLRLWSNETGRVEVSWFDVKELWEVVKVRICE